MDAKLFKALAIQIRVIGALLMREIITRYGRYNLGFIWLFLEPMLFTMGITTVWVIAKITHGANISITAFAVTGYSSLLLWRNSSNRSVKAVESNLSLLYHRPVKVFDILIARLILEIAGATISCTALTIIFYFFGLMNLPEDVLTAVLGWFLLSWFSIALSLIVGAISERSEVIERIWHVITYLMFPLSGATFMIDWLPKSFQTFALWIPMVHATEMIRHGYFGAAIRTYEDPGYLIVINLIVLLIGLAMVREIGHRVELE